MRNEPATYDALVKRAARRLAEAGVSDAQRDALWLLREAAGLDAAALSARLRDRAPEAAATRFEAMLRRREAREPVSHILGRREFWGLSFKADGRALDPRPESETLVERALAHLPADQDAALLDLGVGSGCLLLSVMSERPRAVGLGVDASASALALAAENAARLDAARGVAPLLTPRLTLKRGDWLEGIAERFDLILCNPPYIAAADWAALAPEPRLWEPKAALTPGEDGLAVYRRLAGAVGPRLRPGGAAFFEVGAGQARAVAALLREAGLDAAVHLDLGGVERVVEARP